MAVNIRIDVNVDDKDLLKQLKKFEEKIQPQRKRIARGIATVNYAVKEGSNPITDSLTKRIKDKNLSSKTSIERLLKDIVGSELAKRSPSRAIIWEMRQQDIISPIDKRLISNKKIIGTSDDFLSLQKILAANIEKELTLFITADVSSQIRKGEIPAPPPIKAVVVRSEIGKNIGKLPETTKFISNIQFTILVRNVMTRRMPSGGTSPRLPPPDASKGLTFRTGRFVNTTEFFIDFRNRVIGYFLAFPYSVFLDSGNSEVLKYQPDEKTIIPSIREVAKRFSAEKFNIVRSSNSIF